MRTLADFVRFSLGICLLLGFFLLALVPQVAFGFFIKAGGGIMLLPMIGLGLLGWRIERDDKGRTSFIIVAAILLIMAMVRGFYWHVFETGEGFFTANRVSSLAIFALCFGGATLLRIGQPYLSRLKRQR